MVTKKDVQSELKSIQKKLALLKKEIDGDLSLISVSAKKLNKSCNDILKIFDKMIIPK